MKKLMVFCFAVFVTSGAAASLVSADADGYPNDTNISDEFIGIRLFSVGNISGLDGNVYAHDDGLSSTGTSVFANSSAYERNWCVSDVDGFALKAVFQKPADYVSIDIIGDDISADIGVLEAYNADDNLLELIYTPQLAYGEVYQAEISSSVFNIAYIVAGGAYGNVVHLDNLTANIPEPASILLFAIAGSLLARRTK